MQQRDSHIFLGMQLDLSPTKHKPEFMCDAHNIRITPSDKENTYLSLTNEKGTSKINLSLNLSGYYLGHCTASIYNDYLDKDEDVIILFCTNPNNNSNSNECPDSIYKITLNDDILKPVDILYTGNLRFSIEHPIETFFISEAIDINKVYWNDGYNLPRVINLNSIKYDSLYNKVDPTDSSTWILEDIRNTQFDFIPTLNLEETITIDRQALGGLFSPGVIQYAFSYYNKFGLQSNIFYTSPLNYIMFDNRGGSPDERVPNSFKITILNWQNGFDYLRIYSIHRTTLDAVPQCKIVLDIDLRNITDLEIVFIDNGQIGEFTDPALFPYIGGLNIIALTWDLKDNTLFLGNITLKKPSISTIKINDGGVLTDINTYIQNNKSNILQSQYKSVLRTNPAFKCGEEYRVGFLALYIDGSWSEPIWIDDITIPTTIRPYNDTNNADKVNAPIITCDLPDDILVALKNKGYKNVRGLCVFPRTTERNIIALGIVSPTLVTDIMSNNNIKNINSWFFRPLVPTTKMNLYPVNIHGFSLKDEFSLPSTEENFYVDLSVVSFYSPDVEFNEDLQFIDNEELNLNIFGLVEFDNIQSSRSLYTSSIAKLDNGGEIKDVNTNIVLGVPQWHDGIINVTLARDSEDVEEHKLIPHKNSDIPIEVDYLVYPWQTSGPLNNDIEGNTTPASSVLKNKCLSILLDSSESFRTITLLKSNLPIIGLKVINNTEEILNIVDNSDNTTFKYQENIDTEVMGNPYRSFTYNHKNYLDEDNINFLKKYTPADDLDVIYYSLYSSNKCDITTVNGKNAFINLKYKSPKHLVLNLNKNLLPTIDNFNVEKQNKIIFNNLILSDVFYFKVPSREELEEDNSELVKFSSLSGVNLWEFQILWPALLSYLGGASSVYALSLLEQVLKYNGEPFLMVLDLSNYQLTTTGSSLLPGGKYLTVCRGFKGNSSTQTYQIVQVEFTTLTELIPLLGDVQYIRVPYTYNGEKKVTNFGLTIYPGGMFLFLVEELSTDLSLLAVNGFKVLYDNKLSNISDGNIRDAVNYRSTPHTFPYKILTNGTIVGDLESKFLQNIVDPLLYQEIIPNPLQLDLSYLYNNDPKLFICDIYRDINSITNRFGGLSIEALKANLWIPASVSYNIDLLLDSNIMEINNGDTWFNKYYCLKVYPYANTDENQVINKAGFYCESRYNLYGIYDKDKPSPLLFINKDSFNKFNYVYNQSNNFFNYRILDKEFYTRDNFPYSFIWTKEKVNTAEIDNYTNLNLVSSLDINSVGGEISKIIVHNGLIYCFQPDGINRILFNSRVLIPVSDGVPIEIANSAKLEGVSNITNTIGNNNKWAVVSTNSGLFFIDNRRKGMFLIGEEGYPQNISTLLNMNNWFNKNNFDEWKRDSEGNWLGVKLCDDYNGNDIYLIKNSPIENDIDEGALVYSKRIQQFTSFMSYGETDSIFNQGNSLYSFKTINGEVGLYKMNSGDYNYFFNLYEPFNFSFISIGDSENGGPTVDKTFTNIEVRAAFTDNKYFNYIHVNNDYQDTGVCNINKNILATNRHFSRGDTARKFRIWRTDIPRVIRDNKRTLDRVRNIWTKIKLGVTRESAPNLKMELHDINVLYHI